jgi:uncharacterized protein (DUF4213/DUF364 family)
MQQFKALQLEGDKSNVLSIKLVDILDCIEDANELKWSILWIEGCGVLSSGMSIMDLEDQFNNGETCTLLSLKELYKLSSELEQIIDLTLIGDASSEKLKRYSNEWEIFSNCHYSIQLLDCSYWIVCSENDRTLENINARLQGVKYIDIVS